MQQSESIRTEQWSDSELYTIMCRESHSGKHVSFIRGELCKSLNDFFREVSCSMRFPYYFGWNWAAFDECMTDLEWLSFSGLYIVIDHYQKTFSGKWHSRDYKQTLEKHLSYAVDHWEAQGIPITVILNR